MGHWFHGHSVQKRIFATQEYVYNEKSAKMEVQVTYKLLIGVKDDKHSHILTTCLDVQEIVDPIRKVYLSAVMSDAYRSYVNDCKFKRTEPIKFEYWPRAEYRGEISCFIGMSDLKFKFLYFYKGLTFVWHYLQEENSFVFGGSYMENSPNTSFVHL